MKLEAMLPKESLVTDAARRIEASVREDMRVGDRLPSEAEICRQLGVSRTVVREALAHLRADGLVETRRGQGLFVTEQNVLRIRIGDVEASREGLLEMLELRRGLESETARLAAERRKPDDIERLEAALAALEAADREGRDGVEEDLAFHLLIADIGRNRVLIKMMHFWAGSLRTAIGFLRAADEETPGIIDDRGRRHADICRLIVAGDGEGAHRAMVDHMNHTISRFSSTQSERD
ncbi:FadR family transcriptional regulator [Arsenicitalea aurantiaca]|uniref:FadR family transcriptional regulator n=1 Tax=Arsenicitalea aurantiaca TaxID=1783274 RepID=A0A433XF42_9HYPH|nr:FCD domain-containing protein [Arsenicitalea aurantiaca]RUT32737.1 FadR family transcriptional regulator [Arsenicitalea aurantiaca]